MGFKDKLNSIGIINDIDPLFGGLIPRRETFQNEDGMPSYNQISPPNRGMVINPGSNRSISNYNGNSQPIMPERERFPLAPKNPLDSRDLVFDWTRQKLAQVYKSLSQDTEKLDFEKSKFGAQNELANKEYQHDVENDTETSRFNRDKLKADTDIAHRKAALDEWVKTNPEGEIKTLEDGKIVVIDKRSGKSVDTGLKSDHLTEEEKLKIQHGYRTEEIKQRDDLVSDNVRASDRVNPSQQRTAEIDAANELLNKPEYSWMAQERKGGKKLITIGSTGVVIDRSVFDDDKSGESENAKEVLKKFESDWKSGSDSRMNKSFSSGKDKTTNDTISSDKFPEETVEMIAPDGGKLNVPKNKVTELKGKGAKLVGER